MKRTSTILILLIISASLVAQPGEQKVLIKTTMGNITCKLYNDTPKHRDKFLREAADGYYNQTLIYRVIQDFMIQGGSRDSRNAPKGKRIGYGDPAFTVDDEIRSNHIHKRGALCAPRQPDNINPFKQSDISQFFIVQGRVYRSGELDTMEMAVNIPIKKAIRARILTPAVRAKLKQLKKEKRTAEFRALANPLKEQIDAEYHLSTERLEFTDIQRQTYTTIGGYPDLDGKYTIFGEVVQGFDVIDKIAALKTDANDRPYTDVVISVHPLP